jgi:hypothetical protein
MRKIILVLIIGLFQNLIVNSQTETEIQLQEKFNEAIVLVSKEIIENSKDIVLIRQYSSEKFYKVSVFKDVTLVTNEVLPPEIYHIQPEVIEISKDSISDIIWIKKRQFQSLKMTDSENPFNGLNSRFPSKTFERLQPEISELTKQVYLNKMKSKYGDLRIIKSGDLHQAYFELSKDIEFFSIPINYPQKARVNGTQGMVELGYILNEDYSISDLIIFRSLKDGCTEAVLAAIEELNKRMRDKGYKSIEKIYMEESVIFRLN